MMPVLASARPAFRDALRPALSCLTYRILVPKPFRNVRSGVGGSVIDDDDLGRRMRLGQNALDGFAEIGRAVEHRNDNADVVGHDLPEKSPNAMPGPRPEACAGTPLHTLPPAHRNRKPTLPARVPGAPCRARPPHHLTRARWHRQARRDRRAAPKFRSGDLRPLREVPPTRDAMTGRAICAACKATSPNGSGQRDGIRTAVASAMAWATASGSTHFVK